ncbi:MAG: YegP family protein [Alphaproteobacteria bacterium]|nr:YegP family protein [Alphaproteobacteria bacterium]
MAHPAFQLKKAKNDQYYFVLTAKNGQVIAQSEMYNSKDAAQNGIESVKTNAPVAEMDDQSEAA